MLRKVPPVREAFGKRVLETGGGSLLRDRLRFEPGLADRGYCRAQIEKEDAIHDFRPRWVLAVLGDSQADLSPPGFLFSGCSGAFDDLPRQPVAGRVLFNGRPLPHGMIMFYPLEMSTKDHERVAAGVSIVNGWFSIGRDIKDWCAGKYSVSISSEKEERRMGSGSNARRAPGKPPPPAEHARKIPLRFNNKTELEVSVKEGGIKELKIELPAS